MPEVVSDPGVVWRLWRWLLNLDGSGGRLGLAAVGAEGMSWDADRT